MAARATGAAQSAHQSTVVDWNALHDLLHGNFERFNAHKARVAGAVPSTLPVAPVLVSAESSKARLYVRQRDRWVHDLEETVRATDALNTQITINDVTQGSMGVRAHVLGWDPEGQLVLGWADNSDSTLSHFRLVPKRCVPGRLKCKLRNTLDVRIKLDKVKALTPSCSAGAGSEVWNEYDRHDFVQGEYVRLQCTAAQLGQESAAVATAVATAQDEDGDALRSAVTATDVAAASKCAASPQSKEAAWLIRGGHKRPFENKTVNGAMRDLLMSRVSWAHSANGAKATLSFRYSGVRRSNLVPATGLQQSCSARSFDFGGQSHVASLADIKAAMKQCAVLPYMPRTTRFEGKTAMLEGLHRVLNPSCEREADLEREGLRLTLLAQGLTSLAPRDTRRLAIEKRARFVLCNGQTSQGVKWTKARSCRCGLAGEAGKSLSKRLRAKGCSQQPQVATTPGTILKSRGDIASKQQGARRATK